MPAIRAIAVVAFRRGDMVLLCRGYDSVKRRAFFRAPGGGIEFGETAMQAARREIREEFGLEASRLLHLGTLENLFTHEGVAGHEVVFVFEAPWPQDAGGADVVHGVESDGAAFAAHWFRIDELPPHDGEVVPGGFLDLVRRPS
jgi:ADP-ribose pyrophosphatase YjhB (NUDIX family)